MEKNANAKNQHTCPISSIFDTVNFTEKKTSFSKIGCLQIRHQKKCHSILVISNIVIKLLHTSSNSNFNPAGQMLKTITSDYNYSGLAIKTIEVIVNSVDTCQVMLKTITSDYNYSRQVV